MALLKREVGSFDRRCGWLAALFILVLLFPARLEHGWAFFSTVSVLDPVLLVLSAWVFLASILRGRVSVGEQRVFLVLMLPFVFTLISLAWTLDVSETLKSVVVYGAAVAAYLITLSVFSQWPIVRLLKVTIVLAWILVLTAVVSYVPGSPLAPERTFAHQNLEHSGFLLSYYARFSHPFLGLSNSFATVLVMLIPLVYAAKRVGVWPVGASATVMVLVAAVLATGSRGVILAMLLVFGFLGLYRLYRRGTLPRGLFGGLFGVVGLLVGFLWLSPEALQHVEGRLSAANVDGRLAAFAAALQVGWQGYPFGIGAGVSLGAVSDVGLRSVHNAYLQNILWFGLVGGAVLSLAMWLLPWMVFRIKTLTEDGRVMKVAVATSVLLLMLVNLSQASWEGSVLRVWVYVIVGLGIVMVRKLDARGAE